MLWLTIVTSDEAAVLNVAVGFEDDANGFIVGYHREWCRSHAATKLINKAVVIRIRIDGQRIAAGAHESILQLEPLEGDASSHRVTANQKRQNQ